MARLPNPGTDADTWGIVLNQFLSVAHREDGMLRGTYQVINVRDFGAIGDGRTDDSVAIQAAIDAAIGARDGAAPLSVRTPGAVVYFPAGIYNTTKGFHFHAVQGFHMVGDGPDLTVIRVSQGSILDYVLDIDGSANGIFEAFSLDTEGNGYADRMFYLHWSGPDLIGRSTSNNNIRNVNIGGRFRSGFSIGTQIIDGGWQCDDSIFQNCLVTGTWKAGDSMLGQNGWEFGNGTHGNNINHYLYACSWAQVRYGIQMNASNAMLYGSQPGGCEVDVSIRGATHPIIIDGLRSEASSRLLDHGGGAADSHVSLRNVLWNAQQLDPDGFWIKRNMSGTLHLDNVVCLNPPSGTRPKIKVASAGGNLVSCTAIGVASSSSIEEAFVRDTGANLTVINYHEVNIDNIIQAVTPFRIIQGSSILFQVP